MTLEPSGSRTLLAAHARFLETQRPDVAAIEGLFHHRNVRSALALAEARGALLAALGEFGVPVIEYPPATVKMTICGSGSASKEDVHRAISRTFPTLLVGMDASLPRDATDALAVALCHDVHARFDARTRRLGT
ncbi:MAG: crossover junction endodeoxyribonuclease RuvC [Acidobacteria bacterium]|nr:crossover junction endodeoxyribonuclease RuvC [Acidobacteriota bacterium]